MSAGNVVISEINLEANYDINLSSEELRLFSLIIQWITENELNGSKLILSWDIRVGQRPYVRVSSDLETVGEGDEPIDVYTEKSFTCLGGSLNKVCEALRSAEIDDEPIIEDAVFEGIDNYLTAREEDPLPTGEEEERYGQPSRPEEDPSPST
jgi:hypothetical protein